MELGKGTYMLRPRQDHGQGLRTLNGADSPQSPPDSKVKSLCIKGGRPSGFLIPMQPLKSAQSLGMSSSLSDRATGSDEQSLGEPLSGGYSAEKPHHPDGHFPWKSSSLAQDAVPLSRQEGRSLASQTSEQTRIVTPSALFSPRPAVNPPPAQDRVNWGEGEGKAEGKRRKRKEGLHTDRVTRSSVKNQPSTSKPPEAQMHCSAVPFGDRRHSASTSQNSQSLDMPWGQAGCEGFGLRHSDGQYQSAQQVVPLFKGLTTRQFHSTFCT